jgi:hypothetical protein
MPLIIDLCRAMTGNIGKYLLFWSCIVVFTSCFKNDKIIKLPPQTGSKILTAPMGNKYDTTVYINLQKAEIVKKINNLSWDLRCDASANGYTILMNTGTAVRMYETSFKNIAAVNDLSEEPEMWAYDAPNLLLDSAYLKDWHTGNGVSKNKVYVVRTGDGYFADIAYYKINILSANQVEYIIQYDTLNGNNPKVITVPKNPKKNFVYFSLHTGTSVDGEPDKMDWDIVCTRYSEIFYLNPTLVYPLNGVQINSYNTLGGGDTSRAYNFAAFSADSIDKIPLLKNENSIGYTWKKLVGIGYITHPEYMYLVRTQRNEYFKMHFLDFYYQGEKGFPKMEFERLK